MLLLLDIVFGTRMDGLDRYLFIKRAVVVVPSKRDGGLLFVDGRLAAGGRLRHRRLLRVFVRRHRSS
jgi:hypothetical protein